LWGDNSYNDCAGMAKSSTLAAFLKSNMPYTSGGLLTDHEAWDLAAFVDSRSRPVVSPYPQ
jgi:thiosulfate dehydrogenase